MGTKRLAESAPESDEAAKRARVAGEGGEDAEGGGLALLQGYGSSGDEGERVVGAAEEGESVAGGQEPGYQGVHLRV